MCTLISVVKCIGICVHAISTKIACSDPYIILDIVNIDHDYDIVYTVHYTYHNNKD